MADIGIVTEQGDLGLGFEKLSDKDAKKLKDNEHKDDESNGE